ncbi:MAG: cytochrome c [Verrucomicrobiota bacterium JB023]|nr:cytochrome c [Verrucomicrobiota bacterium JB023]
MLKYFFLVWILVGLMIAGIYGIPGAKDSRPPLRLFPDMDDQDKVSAQTPGGSRLPVAGTVPNTGDDGVFSVEFGAGRTGYYYTGLTDGYFGTGMPEELELTEENVAQFLARGEERYGIYCAICHGESGDGQGTVAMLGVNGVRNLHETGEAGFDAENYPDGRLFEVITNGKGQMGAYGMNIPVNDRWAIVAYVRALQEAREISNNEEETN